MWPDIEKYIQSKLADITTASILFASKVLFQVALESGKLGWNVTKKSAFFLKSFSYYGAIKSGKLGLNIAKNSAFLLKSFSYYSAKTAFKYYDKLSMIRKIYLYHKYNQGTINEFMNPDLSKSDVVGKILVFSFLIFLLNTTFKQFKAKRVREEEGGSTRGREEESV